MILKTLLFRFVSFSFDGLGFKLMVFVYRYLVFRPLYSSVLKCLLNELMSNHDDNDDNKNK